MHPGFLHKHFLSNGGQRLHKWTHYFDIYEHHFARFCGKSPRVMEIGVHGGGSMQMWREYFGPGAQIVGLDINPDCAQYASDNISIIIGSQDDEDVLKAAVADHGPFDIILDDGSHMMQHMIRSFEVLYDTVSPHGVYMVEDVHTSYLPKFDGGLKRPGTFMEFVKDRLDDLYGTRGHSTEEALRFAAATRSISVYDGVVAFERAPQGNRQAPITRSALTVNHADRPRGERRRKNAQVADPA